MQINKRRAVVDRLTVKQKDREISMGIVKQTGREVGRD